MAHSIEQLLEMFEYDPETGVVRWRRTQKGVGKDRIAGRVSNSGYIGIRLDGREYRAHRIAFLIMTGSWPSGDIDHINMVRNDNRWCNLREATRSQNKMNARKNANNKSGLKGVFWHSRDKHYRATITVDYKKYRLGSFDCPAAASFAYQIAADKLHKEFARVR
jgi:hypothetical protein